jgi:hypothetical protein
MRIIKRQLGDRRLGLPPEFPLIDSDEVFVARDRRTHHDRRDADISLEEIEALLSRLRRRDASREQ